MTTGHHIETRHLDAGILYDILRPALQRLRPTQISETLTDLVDAHILTTHLQHLHTTTNHPTK